MKRMMTLISMIALLLAANSLQADTSDVDQQIVGVWQLQMATPDGVDRDPIVLVGRQYDQYAAWYVGDEGLEALKDVRLAGDTLVGSLVPKETADVTVTLEARLNGQNTCTGTGKYRSDDGDSGSWKFSGKRLDPQSFQDLMKWTLEFTTPDYERHTADIFVVSRGGEYYAWYSSKDRELPAQALEINGDHVVMKVTTKTRDGQTVRVKFAGTMNGDMIQGEAEYRLGSDTGSFPFKAKRAT